jgi:hypothetical protein
MDGLHVPSKNNMSNIRDLFARDHREKVPPDLRHALNLLQLNGLEDLEERFLSTEAFLRPWAVFRDSLFVQSAGAISRATQLYPMGTEFGTGLARLDILWYYTQFDEGTLRYDPRADRYNSDYTPDSNVYGLIDKSKWRVEDHEKHMYAWLLQEFKVGKGYSPWRFVCFELKSVCSVWEEIFVPIVNALRASYDSKGRRHYGRLALYVEARCPSRLAFPDINVGLADGGVLSPTPYRVVSMPKTIMGGTGSTLRQYPEDSHRILSRKHYDATERELRDVYPQYGGLVERPKFKHRMDEWLAEQRARADRRKVSEKHGQVQVRRPHVIQKSVSRSPPKPVHAAHKRSTSARGEGSSPIKWCSDSIRRSLSGFKAKDQKSPLHGVTRQLQFPDRTSSLSDDFLQDSMAIASLPRPAMCHRSSDMSVYTSVRNSNPFVEDVQNDLKLVSAQTDTLDIEKPLPRKIREDAIFSPMGQMSAIPPLLNGEAQDLPKLESEGIRNTGPRLPSYEGTAYQKEISLTDLHTRRMLKAARSIEQVRTKTPATRLPAPIVPIPYGGPRVASADTPVKGMAALPNIASSPSTSVTVSGKSVMPKSIVWPRASVTKPKAPDWSGQSPPKSTAWPGFDSDDEDYTPPVPPKSPERHANNPRSRQLMREAKTEREVTRIVSKENIQAALRGFSRESLIEEVPVQSKCFAAPSRTTTPIKHQLQTYNTHLFPRKDERRGTPVNEWVKEDSEHERYDRGGAYEMEVLKEGRAGD